MDKKDKVGVPTIQQLLEWSFINSDLKFAEVSHLTFFEWMSVGNKDRLNILWFDLSDFRLAQLADHYNAVISKKCTPTYTFCCQVLPNFM